MPQLIDKRSGKRIPFADAAKAFRSSGKIDPADAGLPDDQLVGKMARDFSDAYSIEAEPGQPTGAPPATPSPAPAPKSPQIPLNPGAFTLEQAKEAPVTTAAYEWMKNMGKGAVNTVADLGDFAVTVVNAARKKKELGPEITSKVAELARMRPSDPGYAEKYNELRDLEQQGQLPGFSEMLPAVMEMMKQRYGSGEAIARTMYEDPFGALSDVSTIFTAGAGGARAMASAAGRTAKAAKAGSALQKGASAVSTAAGKADPALRKAATFTDPITAPIAAVKMAPGLDYVRKKAGKGMYEYAVGFPDADPVRREMAMKAGVGKDGIPFTSKSEDVGGIIRTPMRKLREALGDPAIPDSIENFDIKNIQPILQRREDIVADLTRQGKIINGESVYNQIIKRVYSEQAGQTGADFIRRNWQKTINGFAQEGIYDARTGKIRNMTPEEAKRVMARITKQQKKNLDMYVAAKGDVNLTDNFEVDKTVLDVLRQEMGVLSPEYAQLGNEASAYIRLKELAQKYRDNPDLKAARSTIIENDKILNASPSGTYITAGVVTGKGTNWYFNLIRGGLEIINTYGRETMIPVARRLYRDPETKPLVPLLLRDLGYNAADIGRATSDETVEQKTDEAMEKTGLHRPRTRMDIIRGVPLDESKINARGARTAAPPAPVAAPASPENLPERLW